MCKATPDAFVGPDPVKRRYGLTLTSKLTPIMTAVALALATPLAAQEAAPAEITSESITDTQVEAFATAVLIVQEMSQEYMPRIQQEQDEAVQKELIEEAQAATIAAIDEVENMSADEYRAIGAIAQNDQELNARIVAQLEDMTAQTQ